MREKQKRSRRKLGIIVDVALIVVVLGTVGLLSFDMSVRGFFKIGNTAAAISDKKVDRLKAKKPELFKGDYATISENKLRDTMQSDQQDRNLLVKEAKRRGITDPTKQLVASFNAIKAGYNSSDEFKQYLSDQGVTEKELKAELENNIIINDLAKSLVSENDISTAEAQSYYEANKSRYPTDYSAAKQQVAADLLGKKRAEAIEELLAKLKSN